VQLSFKQGNIRACLAIGLHTPKYEVSSTSAVFARCDSGGAAAVLPAISTVTWLCECPWQLPQTENLNDRAATHIFCAAARRSTRCLALKR